MEDLVYSPPLLVRVEAEFGIFGPITKSANPEHCRGKYVVYSDGENKVRLYGMLWVKAGDDDEKLTLFSHKKIKDTLEKVGETVDINELLLSGGMITLDDPARTIRVFGRSTTRGRAPKALLERLLAVPDHRVEISAEESALVIPGQEGVREWYGRHGFL
ncbi:hypothetical protein CMO83_00710 [Candidatus Woesearchaeota archaeon]|nr:hypothetical protein [Candidatus Woesearchaeota archaeon]|tara:strand:+ start:43420 stop:43899 length:480 start_codon:yes stop_codon:yes gene_type:complete